MGTRPNTGSSPTRALNASLMRARKARECQKNERFLALTQLVADAYLVTEFS